ncbi:hypothetical protein QI155_03220 [Thermodesulfovibrio sp. 1176]|uniref:hypothetical protein n=1 Tax=Thermodesulfovibrio sp. 1176 TaxID=3043424 RepID=UPI002482EC2A|nr:hypothetical protein [Thermodesulfovibrio sp. 1176]MDI1471534.1 hypothetical protein [Thermodesulfovibrio sp. 1176]
MKTIVRVLRGREKERAYSEFLNESAKRVFGYLKQKGFTEREMLSMSKEEIEKIAEKGKCISILSLLRYFKDGEKIVTTMKKMIENGSLK